MITQLLLNVLPQHAISDQKNTCCSLPHPPTGFCFGCLPTIFRGSFLNRHPFPPSKPARTRPATPICQNICFAATFTRKAVAFLYFWKGLRVVQFDSQVVFPFLHNSRKGTTQRMQILSRQKASIKQSALCRTWFSVLAMNRTKVFLLICTNCGHKEQHFSKVRSNKGLHSLVTTKKRGSTASLEIRTSKKPPNGIQHVRPPRKQIHVAFVNTDMSNHIQQKCQNLFHQLHTSLLILLWLRHTKSQC